MTDRSKGLTAEALARDRRISRDEVCVQCRIDGLMLDALIEHGVVELDDASGFRQAHVVRVTRAVRVMHEFDVDIDSLALVVDLLDALRAQRRELALLRKLASVE